jgi:hypothetical protein
MTEQEQSAFMQLGCGTIAYLKVLDYQDVIDLVGPDAEIEPTEYAVALVDADGSPILLRGSVGACMIAAEESGLHIAPVH